MSWTIERVGEGILATSTDGTTLLWPNVGDAFNFGRGLMMAASLGEDSLDELDHGLPE